MRKIERLLREVLTKYPEIKDYNFSIKYASLHDAYAESEIESLNIEVGINLVKPRKSFLSMANSKNIKIQIDNTLRNKKDALKVAAIASEISHIVKDEKLSHIPLGSIVDGLFYENSKKYRQNDEMRTDLETVQRGFGNELLELLKYEEERGEDEEGEEHEGLTVKALKELLENFPHSLK